MNPAKIDLVIPPDIDFTDLRLRRVPGGIAFEFEPIMRVCEASGFHPDPNADDTAEVFAIVLMQWHDLHVLRGGSPDPIIEAESARFAEIVLREAEESGVTFH
ncbi:MAG: hypothetical protein LBR22_01440 [Desulfovibrio sp.]|nr:hypothetical protein [Desulfovibrio sp.]